MQNLISKVNFINHYKYKKIAQLIRITTIKNQMKRTLKITSNNHGNIITNLTNKKKINKIM